MAMTSSGGSYGYYPLPSQDDIAALGTYSEADPSATVDAEAIVGTLDLSQAEAMLQAASELKRTQRNLVGAS